MSLWRDFLLTLSIVYELHPASLPSGDGAERLEHHPAIAALKWAADDDFAAEVAEARSYYGAMRVLARLEVTAAAA